MKIEKEIVDVFNEFYRENREKLSNMDEKEKLLYAFVDGAQKVVRYIKEIDKKEKDT
jgi:hypothetical protein